ncbi:MAG: hypothetical protein JNJ49_17900 [Bdellovibrionaceae bacterium]|nr:hypothetical protein [Pseudobdellovibrionaceae bacterium]
MRFASLVLVAALSTFSVAQASTAAEYASKVGVEVIAKTVINKKLVDRDARSVLKLALETGRAKFEPMECDRAAGHDICVVDVYHTESSDENSIVSVYRLTVDIRQGNVISAIWERMAG